jgi:hypothetical protein
MRGGGSGARDGSCAARSSCRGASGTLSTTAGAGGAGGCAGVLLVTAAAVSWCATTAGAGRLSRGATGREDGSTVLPAAAGFAIGVREVSPTTASVSSTGFAAAVLATGGTAAGSVAGASGAAVRISADAGVGTVFWRVAR